MVFIYYSVSLFYSKQLLHFECCYSFAENIEFVVFCVFLSFPLPTVWMTDGWMFYTVVRDESLSGSDITSKLEPAFLSGLRCPQPLIRAKFFEVFDSSMKRRVYERLLYICCSQNWEAMGSHFWIKQCTEVRGQGLPCLTKVRGRSVSGGGGERPRSGRPHVTLKAVGRSSPVVQVLEVLGSNPKVPDPYLTPSWQLANPYPTMT